MNSKLEIVLGAGTKAHLGYSATERWLTGIAERAETFAAANLFVAPSFTSLPVARELFSGTGIRWAAQNTHWQSGPYTGEITPETLAELGCSFVEVGHSERRRHFHESDETTLLKARAVVDAGMTPILCVGEREQGDVASAARRVREQVTCVLDGIDSAPVMVAYAPVWAVGADRAADPQHVAGVLGELDRLRSQWGAPMWFIYGGACKLGTYSDLRAVECPVNGPFVGRAAYDIDVLAEIAVEVAGYAVQKVAP